MKTEKELEDVELKALLARNLRENKKSKKKAKKAEEGEGEDGKDDEWDQEIVKCHPQIMFECERSITISFIYLVYFFFLQILRWTFLSLGSELVYSTNHQVHVFKKSI